MKAVSLENKIPLHIMISNAYLALFFTMLYSLEHVKKDWEVLT